MVRHILLLLTCLLFLYINIEPVFCKNINSFEKHYNLGKSLFENEKYPEAIIEFENALQINSQNYKVYNLLGKAYYHINDFQKSVDILNKSLAINNKIAETHGILGITYRKLKNKDKALFEHKEAIKLKPNFPKFYFQFAVTCLDFGEYQEAEKCPCIYIKYIW